MKLQTPPNRLHHHVCLALVEHHATAVVRCAVADDARAGAESHDGRVGDEQPAAGRSRVRKDYAAVLQRERRERLDVARTMTKRAESACGR